MEKPLPDIGSDTIENVMVKIDGKAFRCHCEANVFHHPIKNDKTLYECNACGEWYRGE